jgi:hypothetical protein
MAFQRFPVRRITNSRRLAILALLAGSTLLAGCQTDMTASAPAVTLANPGAPLSFVAIQGPAPEVAQKFESVLAQEARSRGFSVVGPAEADKALRVKTYLDAYASPDGKSGFSWVLDASENGTTRAARIKGAAALPAATSSAWGALDDAAMRQIAKMSVDDLVRHLRGGN